jgi:hypothetical protein
MEIKRKITLKNNFAHIKGPTRKKKKNCCGRATRALINGCHITIARLELNILKPTLLFRSNNPFPHLLVAI